jgi:hypothetical protein
VVTRLRARLIYMKLSSRLAVSGSAGSWASEERIMCEGGVDPQVWACQGRDDSRLLSEHSVVVEGARS